MNSNKHTAKVSRLEALVSEALPRMDEISNFLYWNATQQPGAQMTEGSFYAGGPVCLIATLPNGRQKSTVKARYAARPYWVAEAA